MQLDTRTDAERRYDATRLSPAPIVDDEEIALAQEADRLLAPAPTIDEQIAALVAQLVRTTDDSARRVLTIRMVDLALSEPCPGARFEVEGYDYDGLIARLEAAEARYTPAED